MNGNVCKDGPVSEKRDVINRILTKNRDKVVGLSYGKGNLGAEGHGK